MIVVYYAWILRHSIQGHNILYKYIYLLSMYYTRVWAYIVTAHSYGPKVSGIICTAVYMIMSGMCVSLSGGSLLRWRSGPVVAHIAPYCKHWWTWKTASHYNKGKVWSTGSPVAHVQGCMLARLVGRWIIGWKNTREHSQAGTWPSLLLQSMQLMSHMSSVGKRPRWWTPTHNTIRDAHSSHGTSGQRPPQWTEMMAAYHRLITPSSTTRVNHTPHIRSHTVLSIFNCILSPTTS